MGEKDLTEKVLMSFGEVFADIYNVLLFQKEVISGKNLYAYETESFYRGMEGKMRNQFRDITKRYAVKEQTRCIFCIENESQVDTDMPVRIMGYDYGNYRKMIQQKEETVPVITIVLNFDNQKWSRPLCLKECLSTDDELEPYVRDYGIYVFDVAFLPKEVRERFKSDFGIIADYSRVRNEPSARLRAFGDCARSNTPVICTGLLSAEKDKTNFGLDKREIRHPEEVLDLLAAFADERYGAIKEEIRELVKKGRRVTMDKFVEKLFRQGRSEGRIEGKVEGRVENLITQICKKLQKRKSVEQIADEIEESISFVEQVLEVAKEFAPEYDCEKVCQAWWEKREKDGEIAS